MNDHIMYALVEAQAEPKREHRYVCRWRMSVLWLPGMELAADVARSRGAVVRLGGFHTVKSALTACKMVDIDAYGTGEQLTPLLGYLARIF